MAPAFEFVALTATGKKNKGVIEGEGPREVRDRLRERKLIPLEVREVQRKGGGSFSLRRVSVSVADLALVTRQLSTLIRSGLPLEESLEAVSQQTDHKRLKSVLMAVRGKVLEGHGLVDGLQEFPQVFSTLFRETVGAGEQSGQLEEVMDRLADYLEGSQQLRQKVVLAMIYPVIVLTFAVLVSGALLTFVVPKVVKVFTDMGQELPALTRHLISLSDFLRSDGHLLLLGIMLAIIAFKLGMRRQAFRFLFHRFILKVPLVRRLIRGMNAARFSRTFGILTASGVPVLEGLTISSRVVESLPMRAVVESAAVQVREGSGLYQALSQGDVFTPMVLHLIANGEASGDLAGMLDRAASIQEKEVESLVATLAGVMEPLLILLMGGLVLTIVMAILLPIFDLNQLVR